MTLEKVDIQLKCTDYCEAIKKVYTHNINYKQHK